MNSYYRKKVKKYIADISSGEQEACRYEKLAVDRYLKDLKDRRFVFNESEALRYCNFFNLLKHYKGDFAGKKFILAPWQAFAVWCIFGFRWRKDNRRRFTYADIVVPRKNGKSTFAAGIGLAMLMIDHEHGAEVYSAGTDREQAKIVWDTARQMVEQSPSLKQYLTVYRNSIEMQSSMSFFKPLSKDVKNKDGSNPNCAICDERHAWQTNEMFDILRSGLGARKNPLILSITTAGKDTSAPYFEQMAYLKRLLAGEVQQDNQFAMVWCPDDGDDWKSEKTWRKCNPNFGVSVDKGYFAKECDEAIRKGGATEANFKTKLLDMWVDAPDIWIKDDFVASCDFGTDLDTLKGQSCYAGLDLASHIDFNALALFFPDVTPKVAIVKLWIPEAKITDCYQSDLVDYRKWHEQGWIESVGGDVMNPLLLAQGIMDACKPYQMRNISFDPWKAYHGCIQALQEGGMGDLLDEFPQSMSNMSEPTKTLESLVTSKEIDLCGNPVLRWMFSNAIITSDISGNIKCDRKKSRKKIDGVVALIDAIGGWMSKTAEDRDKIIYRDHGLRTFKL